MENQNGVVLDIKRETKPSPNGVLIEYWLYITNLSEVAVPLVEVRVNNEVLEPEANYLDSQAETRCLICQTGSTLQRIGQFPPYDCKVTWLDALQRQQYASKSYAD